ncbi:20581_t:CDS:2 [Dentiscutata erythropus]|uniref:20581_t:CDS:1 n=1 Tax=Dentiscutata erythropus TaxID=1348616 RepID=A0A9N9I2T0_9GLOM|nr:20581_t:CDS:2 [Dentiscutata erythropus]
MLKNEEENLYNMSNSDKELARLIEPGDTAEKFLTIVSNVVNIIEVIIVLYKSTEYNEHVSNAVIRRITEVIKVIRSLKRCNDEYSEFLNYQSFETIHIFFFDIQKMIKFINEEMLLKISLKYIQTKYIFKELMTEFESFVNFTINTKTLSKKKRNKKTNYKKYFRDINECHNLSSSIVYPIERDEANQLFGVFLVMAKLLEKQTKPTSKDKLIIPVTKNIKKIPSRDDGRNEPKIIIFTSLNNKNFGKLTIDSINENIVNIHNDIIAIERGSAFKEFISVIAFIDTDIII